MVVRLGEKEDYVLLKTTYHSLYDIYCSKNYLQSVSVCAVQLLQRYEQGTHVFPDSALRYSVLPDFQFHSVPVHIGSCKTEPNPPRSSMNS